MNPVREETSRRLEIRPQAGAAAGTLVLHLTGYLDADGAPQLTDELRRQLDAGIKQVDVDLAGVPFISSIGIGSLIAAVGEFKQVGGELVLTGVSEEFRGVLRLLDLLDYIPIH
jgi:anti-sigma B factor antagonist